jgi:hypothetical protein
MDPFFCIVLWITKYTAKWSLLVALINHVKHSSHQYSITKCTHSRWYKTDDLCCINCHISYYHLRSYPRAGIDRRGGFQEVEAPRIFGQSAHKGDKIVSPRHRPPLTFQGRFLKVPAVASSLCSRQNDTEVHVNLSQCKTNLFGSMYL